MFIKRELTDHLIDLAKQFRVIGLIGPRQSGKSTLAQEIFPQHSYVTLEDLDVRHLALEDPRRFLATYANEHGMIIDEIQHAPDLFSYIQTIVDQQRRPGYFVLTGSQNFAMLEKITQSLAGRIALITLLPLSCDELQRAGLLPATAEEAMIKGFYPEVHAEQVKIRTWYANYTASYIERDVRQLTNIDNVISFQRFMQLCAARTGNIVSYADLAKDADISPNTAKAWLSILEASYIIKLLPAYFTNLNKRLIKAPKLHFLDTGLACHLLGITEARELSLHPVRGALFESFVISEMLKNKYNTGSFFEFFYWRDVLSREIDCIIERAYKDIVPVEIKSSMTVTPTMFKGLSQWPTMSGEEPTHPGYIVYAGDKDHLTKQGDVYAWKHVRSLLDSLKKPNTSEKKS